MAVSAGFVSIALSVCLCSDGVQFFLQKYKIKPTEWYCFLCNITLSSLSMAKIHFKGSQHQRRAKGLPVVEKVQPTVKDAYVTFHYPQLLTLKNDFFCANPLFQLLQLIPLTVLLHSSKSAVPSIAGSSFLNISPRSQQCTNFGFRQLSHKTDLC